jgi:hypothetical protein
MMNREQGTGNRKNVAVRAHLTFNSLTPSPLPEYRERGGRFHQHECMNRPFRDRKGSQSSFFVARIGGSLVNWNTYPFADRV